MNNNIGEIISHIKRNRYISLSIYIKNDGLDISGVEVYKRKDEISILNSFRFNDILQLRDHVFGSYPVVLNVDGKGFIHKKISEHEINDEIPRESLFPGINIEEFITQQTIIDNQNIYFSIGRKEKIEEILESFKHINLPVIALCIGPFIVNDFIKFITFLDNVIYLKYWEIKTNQNSLNEVSRNEEEYNTEYLLLEEKIDNDIIVPYCSLLSYLSASIENFKCISALPQIHEMKKELKYRRLLYSIACFGSIFLLIILLLNFMVYIGISKEVSKTEINYLQNKDLLEQLNALDKEFIEKREFIQENNLLQSTRHAWYCDQLAASLIGNIELEELELNPVIGKVRNDKKINVVYNTIVIKGSAKDDEVLSEWMNKISEKDWVTDVVIQNLVHEGNNPLKFTLRVSLNH